LRGRFEERRGEPAVDPERFQDRHGECPDCREYVEQMRQTVRALGTVSEDALSAPAREALLHAFQSWRT
jgi:hypothetical protein